ncbi:MAG: AAA family ATPase, partial [Anaerolineae bacterium]|nr:AAA family ATPase [Anaerolineae bacterium]
MEELRLSLLGDLQVTRGGTPVSGFVSAKVPALLCYLAVTGRPHFRQALAGLLWGDWPEAEALGSLRKALHNLRQLAGAHLVVAGHTIAFDRSSPYWLDVDLFQDEVTKYNNRLELSSPADAAALSRAVDLYRGDLLEGFHVRDAIEFEEWMAAQRERLRLLAGQALDLLSAYHVRQGQYAEATGYVRLLLTLAPWQEETHRQLMWLLARAGQRSAALAQYEVCSRALASELGIEPSDETMALYRRIRAAGAPRPNNLPAPVTSFLGRQRELEQIAHLLDGDARLLTLTGPGGVGKTRLALEAAARATRDATGAFSDGVYFVSLATLPSVDLVAPAVAGTLGVSVEGGLDLPARLLEELRQKEMLLLLDSFEPVMEAAPFVGELLAACTGLKVVVTSREPLNLRGERRVPVLPLAMPELPAAGHAAPVDRVFEPEPYLRSPAIALFVDRAQAVQPGFALGHENADVVAGICTHLDGLPLAIELAAARCGEIPVAAIQAQLSNRLSLLTGGARDLPARQRTLRDTIDWSVRLLPAGEQHLLARLAVFA